MMKRCYPVLGFPSETNKSHYPPDLTLGNLLLVVLRAPQGRHTALGGNLRPVPQGLPPQPGLRSIEQKS